jgi:hypothetical protein
VLHKAEEGLGVVVKYTVFLVVVGEGDESSGQILFVFMPVDIFDLFGDLRYYFSLPLHHPLVFFVLPLPELLAFAELPPPPPALDPALEEPQVLVRHR